MIEHPSMEELIEARYTDDYLGMQPIRIPGFVRPDITILKSYLGRSPQALYFGKILAILKYRDARYFAATFHVWRAHQNAGLANRMTEIAELIPREYMGSYVLDPVDTNFGMKAFWLYTPQSELDEESLALRAVARHLKNYSVSNQLCKKFRNTYKMS